MNTLNSVFEKILCINRTARTDRWANVEAQCKKFGIKLDRFEAHEAANCLVDGRPNGNFACTSSHRGCLELQCFNKWDSMLVLEDDFQIVDESFVEMFDAMWPDVPKEYDWIFLGAGFAEDPKRRINGSVILTNGLMTTSSYGIRLGMARRMAPFVHSTGPIDSIYHHWQRNSQCLIFSPRLIVQRPGFSDLQEKETDNSMSMLDTAHESRFS